MIKVLVVDDSAVVRDFLVHILESDKDIHVVETANDGKEAIEAVKRMKPDVITMDITMPNMNGFEATQEIMSTQPTPIVIVTGNSDVNDKAILFRAMESGALDILQRPAGIGHPEHKATANKLIRTVKLMSEVKVVRRWSKKGHITKDSVVMSKVKIKSAQIEQDIKIVAIGASTGGPMALLKILSRLPKDFPVPVLITQHISKGFINGFVKWMGDVSNLPVHVAMNGDYILPGHIYVAPDDYQMGVKTGNKIELSEDASNTGHIPSVSHLMHSVADVYGPNAVGVLLTGMGKDGAEELKLMKDRGAITIVQDKESSVVHGMPGEAIKLNAQMYILSLEEIADTLINLFH